jgi:uncharacterized protein (TIGR03437 family)
VTIDDLPATVFFADVISPGLFQINAVVRNVADGDQPLLIKIAGVKSPANVVLSIKH